MSSATTTTISLKDHILSYQAIDPAIPEERISKFADLSCEKAKSVLGENAYSQLFSAQDTRLFFAISAFAISMILKSSRMINEGSSIHDVQTFGSSDVRSSEIAEIIRLANDWETQAKDTLNQLRNELANHRATISWIDI